MNEEEKNVVILYETQKFRALDLTDRIKNALKPHFDANVVIVENLKKQQAYLDSLAEKTKFVIVNWNLNVSKGSYFAQYIAHNQKFHGAINLLYGYDLSDSDQRLVMELTNQNFVKNWEDNESWQEAFERELNQSPGAYEIWIKQIDLCIRKNNLSELKLEINSNKDFLNKLKEDLNHLHLYGEILILQNEAQKAVDVLNQRLKEKIGKDVNFWGVKILNTLGKAYCFLGDFSQASVVFQRLSEKSPENLSHKIYFAQALLGLDQNDKADALYDEVLDSAPLSQGYQGKALVATAAGDLKKAESLFSKMDQTQEDPILSSYFNNKGVSLVKQSRFKEAIDFYQNSLFFVKKDRSRVLFNLGLAYHKINDKEKAKETLKEEINLDQGSKLIHKNVLKHYKSLLSNQNKEEKLDLLIIEEKDDKKED
jgi:tetratricopeptide (TPR) repeat protein